MKIIDSKTEHHVYRYPEGSEIVDSEVRLYCTPNQKQFFMIYDLNFKGVIPVPHTHLENELEPMSISCNGKIRINKEQFGSLICNISDFHLNDKCVSLKVNFIGKAGTRKEIFYDQTLCGSYLNKL